MTHLKNWSLTAKLLASVVALFAVVMLAIGGATVVATDRALTQQVSQQLTTMANGPGGRDFDRDGGVSGLPNQCTPRAGGGQGQLALCTSGTSVLTGTVASFGSASTLTSEQAEAITNASYADGGQARVDLGGDLGQYLVVSKQSSSGVTVYTGLPLAKVLDATNHLIRNIAVFSILGLILMGSLGYLLVRRNLIPLRRVASVATAVSQQQLSTGDVSLDTRVPADLANGRTEVGQVGLALNGLLDNVQESLTARHNSETRVRQFVADASHELRTPLASIRGYAELSRKEREPVPTGIRHALDRIESEAKRMTTLVEDLLLLARLDAGRPLEHQPVDLTMLVLESVGDVQVTGPDHTWRLDLPEEAIEVRGDRGRLKQVLSNLLANARNYTPAGTVVTTALRQTSDAAVITVTDNGPGIPESLQPNLFQRFTRGDSSRNRAAGSTGLGLSIVDAVVRAHHGDVRVDSGPGSTVFTVTIPTTLA